MATVLMRHILVLNIFFLLHCVCQNNYMIPPVKVEVLKPTGFRVSIEDHKLLNIFGFSGNINRPIHPADRGHISGTATSAGADGRWTAEDLNVALQTGDVVNYKVFASVRSIGTYPVLFRNVQVYNLSHTVSKKEGSNEFLGDDKTPFKLPLESPPAGECRPTSTMVRGGSACAGQTIFEDHFDSLRESIWQIEQYIPVFSPEYPFNSYQRNPERPTVATSGGFLQISPTLQQDLGGFTNDSVYNGGTLDLFDGCTAPAEACSATASGADILPPVVSGRISSKFAFTYGTVEVRAKLPQGDWLYPDILLEPFLKKYGSQHYASGVLRIAGARGNRQLVAGSTDYSNRVLYGGPIMDFQCHKSLLANKASPGGMLWGDDYHIYSVRWAPERITLLVDGEEWARVEPAASGLAGRVEPAASGLAGRVEPAASGLAGRVEPAASGLAGRVEPAASGLAGRVEPAASGLAGRVEPAASGLAGRVEPAASGLAGRVPRVCEKLPRDRLAKGGAMAPFDDLFYLSLGVSAGSITEFPDGAVSARGPKPWTNAGRKATLAFWQDLAIWSDSWRQPVLSVDYVKVTAL